jgi:hypothetical protein
MHNCASSVLHKSSQRKQTARHILPRTFNNTQHLSNFTDVVVSKKMFHYIKLQSNLVITK